MHTWHTNALSASADALPQYLVQLYSETWADINYGYGWLLHLHLHLTRMRPQTHCLAQILPLSIYLFSCAVLAQFLPSTSIDGFPA